MTKNRLLEIHNRILKTGNIYRVEICNKFFKTGKGEYGEGDIFLGITVPQARKIAKAYSDLSLKATEKLLQSKYHEERFIALIILINKFEKARDLKDKEIIFNLYLKNIKFINNWDLVDVSAGKIVGEYVKQKYSLKTKNCSGVKFLKSLASDKNIYAKNKKEKLWEKRIATIATFAFMMKPIKNDYSPEIIFEIVEKILKEKDELNYHDLIQKACGWMLREYGKRINENKLKDFLFKNFDLIKERRILLRYAIEKMQENERREWLNKK